MGTNNQNQFKEMVEKVVPSSSSPFATKPMKNFRLLIIASAVLMVVFVAFPNAITFLGTGAVVFYTTRGWILSRQQSNEPLEEKMRIILRNVAEYNVDIAIQKAKNPDDNTLTEQSISGALSSEFDMKFIAELNNEQKEWIENTYASMIDEITGVGKQYRYASNDLNDSADRIQRQITAMYRGQEEIGTL